MISFGLFNIFLQSFSSLIFLPFSINQCFKKSYNLGTDASEIECAKIYNQQAMYFNSQFDTKYELNDIPNYITIEKNIYKEIQDNKKERGSSIYHGVSFDKKRNKYRACIVFNKKQIHIGFFEKEIDAANAYNKKAEELNKEFNKKYKLNVL